MNQADERLTLYRLQGCPYCERVVRVLRDFGIEYESRFVDCLHSDRDVLKRVAGVRTVPVLVDHAAEVVMAESENIVEYLRRLEMGGGE